MLDAGAQYTAQHRDTTFERGGRPQCQCGIAIEAPNKFD